MTDILKLQVNDQSLSNIINNNPFYIDIKGSVNICLVRCGQDIDNCNSVNFSSMTNFGKILVLNPDNNTKNKSKCNIKLAFDTSNDNINDNGSGNYNFVKAFFTVPSLHRLNGQIFDMETFLVFSSVQKNGNTLYVVLCTLNSGTNIVQNNDWKLLNFKLIDELMIKNNKVPDIHGTNPINGVPNPIDLNNFIPSEGMRSFYDYTNPNNTNVNVRVYQNPMAVSNDVLNVLKSIIQV
jgi:carbonic anhydrase